MFTLTLFLCHAKTDHLALWKHVTTEDASFKTLKQYLNTYSGWPDEKLVIAKAETYIDYTTSSEVALNWFSKYFPQELETYHVFIFHLLKTKQFKKAKAIVQNIWYNQYLSEEQQHRWINKYGYLLEEKDHFKRLNFLLYNDKDQIAYKLLRYIKNKKVLQSVQLRICLIQNRPNLKLPKHFSIGLLYQYIKYLRKAERNDEAYQILIKYKLDDPQFQKLWAFERQVLARRFLEKKEYKKAYQILHNFPIANTDESRDIKLLKIWIAVEYLSSTKNMILPLQNLFNESTHPFTKSFSAYYLGLIYEKLKQKKESQIWYTRASKRASSFYGMLAREKVTQKPLKFNATPKAKNKYLKPNALIETLLTLDPKNDEQIIEKFIQKAMYTTKSLKSSTELLHLIAKKFSHYHTLLAASLIKRRFYKLPLLHYIYPEIDIGQYSKQEKALILGLIRQESLFNPNALSPAGALGYMQLMPATAKIIAKKHCSRIRNHQDILNNLKWGTFHIKYLIDDYYQSIPLALAAYNAGEHNVDKWLKIYGDPRKKEISMLKWIQLIPFKETRLYVMYVLTHAQLYLYKFGNQQSIKTLLK